MTKMHMVSALNSALHHAMKEDPSVVVLGEDVGVDGGVFRVTDGLIDTYGKDRVFDTPLAEAGIVGCSIGMSINGLKPIAEMQFSGFGYQAFHHVKQHMARVAQRGNGSMRVPMVLRLPCSGGIRALEHHSESPENFYIHCQGLKVVIPSGPYDAKGLLSSAIKDPNPVIFLEPKKVYRSFKEEVPEEAYDIPIGPANVIQEGDALTIVTWGAMVKLVKDSLEDIEAAAGGKVEVIDLRTLWPLDEKTIVDSAQKTGRVIVVHEATLAGGFGGEIAARIQENALLSLKGPVLRVTAPSVPYPHFALENYHLPNKKRILLKVKELMEY